MNKIMMTFTNLMQDHPNNKTKTWNNRNIQKVGRRIKNNI